MAALLHPIQDRDVQIICAPSILGLKPSGVELMAETLLRNGFAEKIHSQRPIEHFPKNNQYSFIRDKETKCLNPTLIHDFSLDLIPCIQSEVKAGNFPIVLGGDCSVLVGIMPGLKLEGKYGLVFIDAHADFYLPLQSTTGEVADMDLSIVTGRGPEILTNIMGLKPYVSINDVIHIAQRDAEEAKKFGSADIRQTTASCFDIKLINQKGITHVIPLIVEQIHKSTVSSYWLHFDTDSLHDDENPCVDYRLAGGLHFTEANLLLSSLLKTKKIIGMSVTIFNPSMDRKNKVGKQLTDLLANVISSSRIKDY